MSLQLAKLVIATVLILGGAVVFALARWSLTTYRRLHAVDWRLVERQATLDIWSALGVDEFEATEFYETELRHLLRTLRNAGRFAWSLGLVAVLVALAWGYVGEHGLLGLVRARVDQVMQELMIMSFCIGALNWGALWFVRRRLKRSIASFVAPQRRYVSRREDARFDES